MTYLQIQFWKIAIWLIRKDYGCGCKDFAEGCPECEASVIVAWIEGHIELLENYSSI